MLRELARDARRALEWEDPVDRVRGLGPAARAALAKVGVTTVADLIWTLPVAWDDARSPVSVSEAIARARAEPLGARVSLRGVVKSAGLVPMRGRRGIRVTLAPDASDRGKEGVALWWFFVAHGILALATPGTALLVTGRIRAEPGKAPRMAHPDVTRDEPAARVLRPRYARLGVPEGALRKAIGQALDGVSQVPDLVPAAIAAREKLSPASPLLAALHRGEGAGPGGPSESTRRAAIERLAWAEAFARVWERVAAEGGEEEGKRRAPPLPVDRSALARLRAELGFTLTQEQEKAIALIGRDLTQPIPMRRLLLGDVGTGKTAVALAAAAQCVSAGAQVAILAPTSILAEQYMDAVAPLARSTGASVALFAAGVGTPQRRRREAALATGAISIAVGTHALLREQVALKNLGLVIVDEQHRLGVAQRLALVRKRGDGTPHLLTLSATPIPRTLALALRGELQTCELGTRPKGRPPVTTELRPRSSFPSVVGDLRIVCARGERAFVVAPRIEEQAGEGGEGASEGSETESTERLAASLSRALAPFRVGVVHGGLSADEKRSAMRAFRAGETLVLVGTSVVEVGLDVPQATLMVVCNAERFGLAQLHQLRGRVGRGDRPGRCLLVHGEPLEGLASARLAALARLERGVDVARADLELRGAGDLAGTRQSGAEEELLYLDPASPPPWLARMESDVRGIFATDPQLAHEEHCALRIAVRRLAVAISTREEAG